MLVQDPQTKALNVELFIQNLSPKTVMLTVVSGLFVVDDRGQVYVPLPDRFNIGSSTIQLKVVPLSYGMPPTGRAPSDLSGDIMSYWKARTRGPTPFKEFPAVFDKMEQLNGHWKFRSSP